MPHLTTSLRRLASAILALTLLASCDGSILVEGRVWSSEDQQGRSRIVFEDSEAQSGHLVPLEGASIELIQVRPSKSLDSTTSDADGSFILGNATAPGALEMVLVASKDGCGSIEHKFRNTDLQYAVSVILYCDSSVGLDPGR